MTLTENFIRDAIHLDSDAEIIYGSDEVFDTYPCRFATVEFMLTATDTLVEVADRIRMEKGYIPMHAHYISYSVFSKATTLFKAVNKELSKENDKLVQFPELVKKDDAMSNVINDILAEYGDTPISVIEAWLSTSGTKVKEYIKGLLEE